MILLLAVTSCAAGTEPGGTVEGLVVEVTGDLVSVEEFRLLTDDGEVEVEVDTRSVFLFPEPHLRDHLRSGRPVVVEYHIEDDRLIAISVDDG